MMTDDIAGSSRILSRMAKKLRNVCVKAMKRRKRRKGQRQGGRKEFVVIDESHFRHKRKVSGNSLMPKISVGIPATNPGPFSSIVLE